MLALTSLYRLVLKNREIDREEVMMRENDCGVVESSRIWSDLSHQLIFLRLSVRAVGEPMRMTYLENKKKAHANVIFHITCGAPPCNRL